ncbi:MAG: hypothetical protein CSA83_02095, partial [Actinomycetales bacterium]
STTTTRTYSLGTVYPGERLVIHLSAKVRRSDTTQYLGNQAYYTSDQTPITGLHGGNTPDPMTIPDADEYDPDGIPNNSTCNTDADTSGQSPEDICDQVPAEIPANPDPLGALSGTVWIDTNNDGLRQTTEDLVENVKVILLDNNDQVVGETQTDNNGYYIFNNLVPADYKVQVEALGLTAPNGKKYGFTTQDADTNPSSNQDSDVDNTGLTNPVTVTANNTREYVDAGLVTVDANIQVDKTSTLGDPATLTLNNQGTTDELTINITVTNNGEEPLTDFKIEDTTLTGPDITNLTCTYNSNPITPTTVIPVNDTVNCTAILPSMDAGSVHEDSITVNGVGTISQTTVSDDDPFKAESPAPNPQIQIIKYVVTGPNPDTDPTHRVDANDFNNPVIVDTTTPSFLYEVTNTGNVKLDNVVVTAPTPGQTITCPKTTLLVGEVMYCTV